MHYCSFQMLARMITCHFHHYSNKRAIESFFFFKKVPIKLKYGEYKKCAEADSTSPCELSKLMLKWTVRTYVGARKLVFLSRGQNALDIRGKLGGNLRECHSSVSPWCLQYGEGLNFPRNVPNSCGCSLILWFWLEELKETGPPGTRAWEHVFPVWQGPLFAVPCDAGGPGHAEELCGHWWE